MATLFPHHRLIVGYHGCDRSVAESVLLRGAPLKRSSNPWDWLGEGVYFWEHGPERALEFARWKQRRGELDEPFVLGAYVSLGRCFDLTDLAATRELAEMHEAFTRVMAAHGAEMPSNEAGAQGDEDLVKRFLDCSVLNFGLRSWAARSPAHVYDTVRGVFMEGPPAFPGARVFVRTHIQVAVRNPECVLGVFRPMR